MPIPLAPTRPTPNFAPPLPAFSISALFILLMSACAPLQQQAEPSTLPPPPSWPAHRMAMMAIDSWQIKGKLAYRNDTDSGSAWFDWSQQGDKFTIYLSGPFGVGTVIIRGNAQTITLSQPGEADINAHSSSGLTQQLFGWQLPVEQMRSWVRGIPASSSNDVIKRFNAEGLLDYLQEDDWQLSISLYQAGPHGPLPGRIKGHSDKLSFTLLLKEWSFPEHDPQRNTLNPDTPKQSTLNPSTSNPSHSLDK